MADQIKKRITQMKKSEILLMEAFREYFKDKETDGHQKNMMKIIFSLAIQTRENTNKETSFYDGVSTIEQLREKSKIAGEYEKIGFIINTIKREMPLLGQLLCYEDKVRKANLRPIQPLKQQKRVANDCFFTPSDTVQKCIDYVKTNIPVDSISTIIEPSCGDGSFVKKLMADYSFSQIPFKYCVDIKKQIDDEVLFKSGFQFTECDFCKWKCPSESLSLSPSLESRSKVLVIGNPPFGASSSMILKFLQHCVAFSDYVAFILPLSWSKSSVYNQAPSLLHLIASPPLCFSEDVFNGTKVRTAFYVFEKRETKRSKEIDAITLDFDFVPLSTTKSNKEETKFGNKKCIFTIPSQFDFCIRRCGGDSTGTVMTFNEFQDYFLKANKKGANSFYFCICNTKVTSLDEILSNFKKSRHELKKMSRLTAHQSSLTMAEIISVYENNKE